jgi:hypothetical protein
MSEYAYLYETIPPGGRILLAHDDNALLPKGREYQFLRRINLESAELDAAGTANTKEAKDELKKKVAYPFIPTDRAK